MKAKLFDNTMKSNPGPYRPVVKEAPPFQKDR